MSDFGRTQQGDTRTVTLTLAAGGVAVNITGAALTGWIQNTRTRAAYDLTGALAVVDGAAGIFSWKRSAQDTGTPGTWRVYFRIDVGATTYRTLAASWAVANSPDFLDIEPPLVSLVGVTPDEGAWLTLARTTLPAAGDLIGDAVDASNYLRTAGAWVAAGTAAYDTQLGFNEKPGDSAVDFVSIGRACTFKRSNPSSVTSGYAYALTGPAATATFELFLNSTKIEEIEWNTTDDKVGSFSGDIATTDVAIAAGDRLRLVAPASADADLADIRIVVRLEVA